LFVLLAIVFFSGFALPLDALRQPAITISYLLPATYGVTLFQNVMLRGLPADPQFLLALFAISLLLFVASWALLRWRTPAG
jgi:ABC-2 type transport system permease protein